MHLHYILPGPRLYHHLASPPQISTSISVTTTITKSARSAKDFLQAIRNIHNNVYALATHKSPPSKGSALANDHNPQTIMPRFEIFQSSRSHSFVSIHFAEEKSGSLGLLVAETLRRITKA